MHELIDAPKNPLTNPILGAEKKKPYPPYWRVKGLKLEMGIPPCHMCPSVSGK